MKCKYCGEVLEDDSRFCYRCGKAAEPKPAKRHCGYCGAELETGAAFCWKCGKAVSSTAQSEVAEKSGETSAVSNVGKPPKPEAEEKIALKARTAALVIAAQSGDSDSFTELYRLYNQKIFALARTTVRSNADAEDVLQMTFLKAWNHLGKLKNPSAFSTWIQRITLNQCYSLLRKKHIDISIDDDDEDTEPIQPESDLMLPEVYAERSDLKERLARIIRSLSTVQQQTVTLYYFDGLPVENIAWIMDCSVNTVKSRLFLARKSIKTEIEEQERKSGQPFYGIVGLGTIPFGKLFVEQVEANALPQSAVSKVLESITRYIVESVAKNVGQAAAETARSAGDASAKTAANGAAKAAVRTAAKAGAGTAAKAAAAAVSKKIIAGIVAGVLAVGAVTGGTVAAVSAFQKQKGAAPATETLAAASADTAPQPESAFTIVTEEGLTDPFSNPELQSAYRAYLSLLEEEKEGIDNYIWQKGYTLRYDEDDRELLPLTDDLLARPVAICDVYGDDTPELIFIGDVAPGEWNVWEWGEVWYQNDSVARLHIVTYQDGKAVTLYDDDWDGWGDSWNSYHFFQTDGSKDLYATWSNGDLTFWDYVYSFTEGTDGKLHKEQVCLFLDDEDDGKLYYGGHNQRISEDEYHSMLRSFSENTINILMYSHIGIEEFRSSVEQHGCSAMTCGEAITYLRKQLGISEPIVVQREPETIPMDRDKIIEAAGYEWDPERPICVKKNGKYGYYSQDGRIQIPFEYDYGAEFFGNYAVVFKRNNDGSNRYDLIDPSNQSYMHYISMEGGLSNLPIGKNILLYETDTFTAYTGDLSAVPGRFYYDYWSDGITGYYAMMNEANDTASLYDANHIFLFSVPGTGGNDSGFTEVPGMEPYFWASIYENGVHYLLIYSLPDGTLIYKGEYYGAYWWKSEGVFLLGRKNTSSSNKLVVIKPDGGIFEKVYSKEVGAGYVDNNTVLQVTAIDGTNRSYEFYDLKTNELLGHSNYPRTNPSRKTIRSRYLLENAGIEEIKTRSDGTSIKCFYANTNLNIKNITGADLRYYYDTSHMVRDCYDFVIIDANSEETIFRRDCETVLGPLSEADTGYFFDVPFVAVLDSEGEWYVCNLLTHKIKHITVDNEEEIAIRHLDTNYLVFIDRQQTEYYFNFDLELAFSIARY